MKRPTVLALALVTAACAKDLAIGPQGTAFVVQVTNVRPAEIEMRCARRDLPTLINVTMVNTTRESVVLTRVSSTGVLIDGLTNARPALEFASLEFTPITLRAHDGQATTKVTMPPTCAVIGEVLTTLYMTTTAGQYTTMPTTILVTPR